MLFNSLQFLLFFPIVTVIYFLLPHRFRWIHLLAASCYFYMTFYPIYILILFFTIIIDYIAGILIEGASAERRKPFLIMSIVANVGVLAFFKYYNFFTDNVNVLLSTLHITAHSVPYLNILLPIGLSFHTFQAMSYTIEVYRGNQKAERHFGIYALYVMFYPQLVAGPIERPQNMIHQFKEEHTYSSEQLFDGLRLMLWGFFKKLVIADRLAIYVNLVFGAPGHYHFLNLLIAMLCFSIQIYCDFSGYSDIAIGSAKTMGFDLMVNFNRPFLYSTNISEFWRRWHISLYTWFTDYVYSPIVVAYRHSGRWGIAAAIMITFMLSGLWHGANWTFVIFGLLHGSAIVYEMLTKKSRKKASKKMPAWFYQKSSILLTFLFLNVTWIFFRSDSVTTAMMIFKHIFTLYHGTPFMLDLKSVDSAFYFGRLSIAVSLVMTAFLFITESILSVHMTELNQKPISNFVFCTFILASIIIFGVFTSNSFIYFQF